MTIHEDRAARRVGYCGTCKQELPASFFYKASTGTNGLFSNCKACCSSKSKAKFLSEAHLIRIAVAKAQRIAKEEERLEQNKRLCPNCGKFYTRKPGMRWSRFASRKLCRRDCPVPIAVKEARIEASRLQALEYAKEYGKRPVVREKIRERMSHCKHMTAWRTLLRNAHKQANTEKSGSTISELGYSGLELKLHMEALFTEGMSWANHGAWHIDHIKPVSKFPKDSLPSEVNALKNLQPLWAAENIRKYNHYIE